MMPDKEGKHANIIQGHDSIKGVMESPEPYLSTLVGRYANRIARGRFQLHGKEYSLAINNGPQLPPRRQAGIQRQGMGRHAGESSRRGHEIHQSLWRGGLLW